MPYLYTHYFTGGLALANMSGGAKSLVLAHPDAYRLGCQGPDVFYFHYMLKPKLSRSDLAPRFHREEVERTLAALLDGALAGGAKLAYFLGYLSHYALDCVAHPYINHRCCSEDHTRFEAHLDSALIRHLGHDLAQLPPYTLFTIGAAALTEIDALVADAAQAAFGERIRGIYQKAWADMVDIQRLIFDPHRLKRPFFAVLERLSGKPRAITGKLFERNVRDGIDYLNLTEDKWCLPWDAEITCYDSFPMLMERAARLSAGFAEAVLGVLEGAPREEALALFGGNSLDSGLPWQETPAFTAVKCVYSHKK